MRDYQEAGQVYRSLGVKQAQQIAALKQELARYGAADPARLAGEADPLVIGLYPSGNLEAKRNVEGMAKVNSKAP